MRRRGRGHKETAAAWRQQQRLSALREECLAAPGHELLPLWVAHEVGKALNTLGCGISRDSESRGGRQQLPAKRADAGSNSRHGDADSHCSSEPDETEGDWSLADEEALIAAAADHLRITVQQHGGGQFVTSLAHAYLFMAWEELRRCVLQPEEAQTDGEETAEEGYEPPWRAEADFLGPAAGWRLSTRRYGAMLCALGWHPLLLDAMLWLPPVETAAAQQLLTALARDAPAAAVDAMRLLRAPRHCGKPCSWWIALMQGLCPERACTDVGESADRAALVMQLAEAAAWALSLRRGGDDINGCSVLGEDDSICVARVVAGAALPLLEHLLGAWQGELFLVAAQGAPLSVADSLRALQPLLQAAVAARTAPVGGIHSSGNVSPAAEMLEVATLVHANTRVMLSLMAWQGTIGTSKAEVVSGAPPDAAMPQMPADANAWASLLKHPAQPDAIPWRTPGASAPWSIVLQRGVGSSSGGAAVQQAQSHPTVSSRLLLGIIAQVQRGTNSSGAIHISKQEGWALSPLLRVDGRISNSPPGSLDAATAHCLALACAWLTPGAPCWWPLPLNRSLQAAAGADPFAPSLVLAALLDMLVHAQQLVSRGGQLASATLHPSAVPLLLALTVGVGSEVVAPEQQAALLVAAYAPPVPTHSSAVSARAVAASRRLAALQEALWCGEAVVGCASSATTALVSISNRLISRDEAGQEVVPSREQQARAAAEAARSLLPHALLWPGAVLQRLLQDGVEHGAQQPVIVEVMGSLAQLCRSKMRQTPNTSQSSLLPGRLLRGLHEGLLGGCNTAGVGGAPQVVALSAAQRAAAVQLVRRLLSAKLLDAQEALADLVTAPLAEVWKIFSSSSSSSSSGGGGDLGRSSGWQDSGSHWQLGLRRLRTLLDLAEVLLGTSHSAAPALTLSDRWVIARGICAVADRLVAGEAGGGSGSAMNVPDLPGLAQAERLLEALVASPAALQESKQPIHQEADCSTVAADLLALPWEWRLAMIPLVELTIAGASGSDHQAVRNVLSQPPAAPLPIGVSDAGLGAAIAAVRHALAFAASSDAHAVLLAQLLQQQCHLPASIHSNSTTMAVSGSMGLLANEVAACVTAAVLAVPGDTLRRALLLALGELLPRATEVAGARAAQIMLPALVAGRLQLHGAAIVGISLDAEPGMLAKAAALQLVCRGVAVYLDSFACATNPAAAAGWRQATEQCCRHINGLALLLMGPAAAQIQQQQQQQQPGSSEAAHYDAVHLCLRECCRLAAALPRACDASPLRALLLHTVTVAARPPVVLARQKRPADAFVDAGSNPSLFPAHTTAASVPQSPLGLTAVVLQPSGQPFASALADAAQQVALTPPQLQGLLLPALAHVGAATAAAALLPGGSGAPAALQDEVEGVVEAAAAATAAAALVG